MRPPPPQEIAGLTDGLSTRTLREADSPLVRLIHHLFNGCF